MKCWRTCYYKLRKYIVVIIISISIVAMLGIVEYSKGGDVFNVIVQSQDGLIDVSWDKPLLSQCNLMKVIIKESEKGIIVYEEDVEISKETVKYTEGIHGVPYTVAVVPHYMDGSWGERIDEEVLFLEFDKLPAIPLIVIDTETGEEPTYDEAQGPEGMWGATIVNNEYIPAKMVIQDGDSIKSMYIEIRVRGNTSSVMNEKKSYGIKLFEASSLIGEEHQSEYELLNNGTDLNNYIGNYVGELCGMEWQPAMKFVNVLLNGDWKGTYVLAEAINIETASGYVGESGYIFEKDSYWWNANGVYFRTNNLIKQMGYTIKYPDVFDDQQVELVNLQYYMQELEDELLVGGEYKEYIDEENFCRWILARDILGNSDGAGSNMFYYKSDFDSRCPTSSLIKMGPLWDFGTVFVNEGMWSNSRKYMEEYFEQKSFVETYINTWEEISVTLEDNIKCKLDNLAMKQGDALDESWELDGARWKKEVQSFEEQRKRVEDWFSNRVVWIDKSM